MDQKVAVVTGGASGMGLELAKELGKFGSVFIGDISEVKIEQSLEEMRGLGIEAYGQKCDISDPASVEIFAQPESPSAREILKQF